MLYSADGVIATLTLDHPENRNALTPSLLRDLSAGLERAEKDPLVRIVVLTNTGPVFSAGADLKADRPGPQQVTDYGQASSDAPAVGLEDVMVQIQRLSVPVIARIAGHCVAGGVGLAAACDILIAADDIWFGFSEVRIGVAPVVISVVIMPRLRYCDVTELFLTGRRVTAARAAEIGLVNHCVPRAELDRDVRRVAEEIALGGPSAIAAVKELIRVVPRLPDSEVYEWATRRSAELFSSPEAAAGMAAFRAKSSPPWVDQGSAGKPQGS